ncbi:hypothetical protein [Planctopirus limnophila]|uniref:hypothetical protein n=1 Tax=Planctopirus limnophila TaxID=120 RepID=UPI0018C32641|nr:hypothetical protein [Planctopirus limnophila]
MMVISHLQEILIYSAIDGSPIWRQQCQTEIKSVSANAGFVYALDNSKQIHRWEALKGEIHESLSLPEQPLGMAVSAEGDCAVFSPNHLFLLRDLKIVQSIDRSSISAVGWVDDAGDILAIGDQTGQLWFFEWRMDSGMNLHPAGYLKLNCSVEYIHWDHCQSWVVVAGGEIWQISRNGQKSNKIIDMFQQPIHHLAISVDGNHLAVAVGQQTVLVFRLGKAQIGNPGQFDYQDRTIAGLGFGLDATLFIGLDTGDGNIFDLSTSELTFIRTDPHPGRPLTLWTLSFDLLNVLPNPEVSYDRKSKNPLTAYLATREEISRQVSTKKYPAWIGPILGMIAGLVFGARLAKDLPGNEVLAFAVAIGIGGFAGSIVMLLDLMKRK